MLETIGIFVAKSLAGYGFKKGLDKIFDDLASFENNLGLIINETVDQFKQKYPIEHEEGKFPFYDSRIILDELLKFRFFANGGYQIDENRIAAELRKNPFIIPPTTEQLQNFIALFDHNVAKNELLKKLEEDENYKSEIFRNAQKLSLISAQLGDLLEKFDQISGKKHAALPKEITLPFESPKKISLAGNPIWHSYAGLWWKKAKQR